MSVLMAAGSMTTAEIRLKLAEAKNTIRSAKAEIDDVQHNVRERLLASAGGDVKNIGSNQELREDRYRSAYGADAAWIRARADFLQASEDAEILAAILDGRIDALAEQRLEADNKRTASIYACLDVFQKPTAMDEEVVNASDALASAGVGFAS